MLVKHFIFDLFSTVTMGMNVFPFSSFKLFLAPFYSSSINMFVSLFLFSPFKSVSVCVVCLHGYSRYDTSVCFDLP